MWYEGLCLLLPSRPFDSGSRKRLPTHRLYPTIWLPDGQGAKVLGKWVYASETHSCRSSLLSVYHYWGGEHWCRYIIYGLTFIVVCILGSIYSDINCLPSLRSLYFRPESLTSSASCWILKLITYTSNPTCICGPIQFKPPTHQLPSSLEPTSSLWTTRGPPV